MSSPAPPSSSPLVSTAWLASNLANVKVFDASWYQPILGRDTKAEFAKERIPSSSFFDIDEVAARDATFSHTFPSAAEFEEGVRRLGINQDDFVVVYDTSPYFFAASRAWWMFRSFGHDKVAVLNGGFSKWKAEGLDTESGEVSVVSGEGDFKASGDGTSLFLSLEDVKKNLDTKELEVLDARPQGRFDGVMAEPRKGIPSGHIDGCTAFPYSEVCDGKGCLLSDDKLKEIFAKRSVDTSKPLAVMCGSGISAATVALALYQLGIKQVPMYDGSWTEWVTQEREHPHTVAIEVNSN